MGVTCMAKIPDTRRPYPIRGWQYTYSWHGLLSDVFLNEIQQIDGGCTSSVVAIAIVFTPITVVAHPFDYQWMDKREVAQREVKSRCLHFDSDRFAIMTLDQLRKGVVSTHGHTRSY